MVINAVIGTIQEWKAEKSASQLQTILKIMSRVRREEVELKILAEEIVPGDVVLIESGSRIPADLRILYASNLTIDESLLTGESAAVEKTADVLKENTPASDRHNMAYAGSTAITGRACGVVTATGSRTEVGMIARASTENQQSRLYFTHGRFFPKDRNRRGCSKWSNECSCPFTGDCTCGGFLPCNSSDSVCNS